ncbi:MAG TPA: DAK2 domain-containing protein [Acidimicrobiales bacterium]|nr:DAK2 domain-containing protein [Acidimicrobiales bacterium]
MRTLQRLEAADLASVVVAYRDALRSHQEEINRLNVYPVPDGDTGTNMALTLESVVAELPDVTTAEMAAVCSAVSHGSLMGARGNSGVILSQILRGVADAFRAGGGDGRTVADALARAAAGAYQAVMRPVEGTILSVVKAASLAADACPAASLVEVLDAARSAAATALARTPEQLPVLKAAGVVDAGGAGFLLLLDAFLHRSAERPLPEPAPSDVPAVAVAVVSPGGDALGDLRYEVMYLLAAPDDAIAPFREAWAAIGDSIVVVGGDGLWNCHIHTDDIGAAVEAGVDAGRPRQIRVTDLRDQVEEERWVREAPAVRCATVAVATGAGITRILLSLGVQQTVTGGQTMNPSTAQLLGAIDAAPGPEVVILPNNKNIIPVAEQAARLAAKVARVVPTHGIAEGFAALLAYDPQAGAEENARDMGQAAARVITGEITRAVRSSTSDVGPINEGDFLGISRGGIEVVAPALTDAACQLLAKLLDDEHEIVTIFEGEGATSADTGHITEWLNDKRPDVTAEVHKGGQPLYPYLLSIE